jgi:hypothetical protein
MQSVVSYPNRGVGGDNTYRGNCAPQMIEDIIKQFNIRYLSDYMVGSGTTEDVCKRLGVKGTYLDLNRGFNMMSMDIPDRPQNIFWHPPYDDIVVYSDRMYKAKSIIEKFGFDPRIDDLSRCKNWDDFVKKMNYCCVKQFASLEKGGRMFVLMGDIKKRGKLYSMICDLNKVGTLEQIVVKMQHNCVSDRCTYYGNFIPIVHEYLMIVRKDNALIFPVKMSSVKMFDMRHSCSTTWLDVISAVLEESDGPMTLSDIYQSIEGHNKCNNNKFWKEKIRQTLLINKRFQRVSEGVWCIAA